MAGKHPPLPYFSTERTQELWNTLQLDNRLIAFYRPLVDVLHSVKATVLLSQMLYWTRTGKDIDQYDGWFYKTADQFAQETGLSRYEQETARKRLRNLGLVHVKMKGLPNAPMPARPWYRVNLEGLSSALAQALNINALPLSVADLRLNTAHLTTYLSKPIVYHTGLAKVAEGVNAGLMLSCLAYSYRNGYNQQRFKGFVSRNIKVWQKEVGLTYDEQIHARRQLLSRGLIIERHLSASRNIFTEINFAKCCDLLLKINTSVDPDKHQKDEQKRALQYAEKGVGSYGKTPNKAMAKVGIKLRQNPELSYGETPNKAMAKVRIPNKEQNTLKPEYGFTDYSNKPQPPQAPQPTQAVPCSVESGPDKPDVVVVNDETARWIWPKCLADRQDRQIACHKLMQCPAMAQVLLDEMSGNERSGKTISMPQRYLDRLIGLLHSGGFVAEVAHKVKASRDAQYKQDMAQQAAHATKPLKRASQEVYEASMNRIRRLGMGKTQR